MRGIIAVSGGFLTALVCTAVCWYCLDFYESSTGSMIPPISSTPGSPLAFYLGAFIGGLFRIIAAPIVLACRQNKAYSAMIGAGLGFLLFMFLLAPATGGISNASFFALASFIPIGALTGFVSSLLFGK